jgi:hypothetical protein
MRKTLKDFRESEAFYNASPGSRWHMQDFALLVTLTAAAIIAIAAFAYVVVTFAH